MTSRQFNKRLDSRQLASVVWLNLPMNLPIYFWWVQILRGNLYLLFSQLFY